MISPRRLLPSSLSAAIGLAAAAIICSAASSSRKQEVTLSWPRPREAVRVLRTTFECARGRCLPIGQAETKKGGGGSPTSEAGSAQHNPNAELLMELDRLLDLERRLLRAAGAGVGPAAAPMILSLM